jgi:hypothetical protein
MVHQGRPSKRGALSALLSCFSARRLTFRNETRMHTPLGRLVYCRPSALAGEVAKTVCRLFSRSC